MFSAKVAGIVNSTSRRSLELGRDQTRCPHHAMRSNTMSVVLLGHDGLPEVEVNRLRYTIYRVDELGAEIVGSGRYASQT